MQDGKQIFNVVTSNANHRLCHPVNTKAWVMPLLMWQLQKESGWRTRWWQRATYGIVPPGLASVGGLVPELESWEPHLPRLLRPQTQGAEIMPHFSPRGSFFNAWLPAPVPSEHL